MAERMSFEQQIDGMAKARAARAALEAADAPKPQPKQRTRYYYRARPGDPPVGLTKAFLASETNDDGSPIVLIAPKFCDPRDAKCIRAVKDGDEVDQVEGMAWRSSPDLDFAATLRIVGPDGKERGIGRLA